MERTMPRDYYEVLGVQRTASKDEIKQAFRQLARQHHPDVSNAPDAEDKFKEINEAYQVLSDDNRRAAYDRFGHAGVTNGGSPGAGLAVDSQALMKSSRNFSAGWAVLVSTQAAGRAVPLAGAICGMISKSIFQQAIFGAEIDLELQRREKCDVCSGSGAKPGTSPRRCPECNGTGQSRRVQQNFFNMVTVTDCPAAGVKGRSSTPPAPSAVGPGRYWVHAPSNSKCRRA